MAEKLKTDKDLPRWQVPGQVLKERGVCTAICGVYDLLLRLDQICFSDWTINCSTPSTVLVAFFTYQGLGHGAGLPVPTHGHGLVVDDFQLGLPRSRPFVCHHFSLLPMAADHPFNLVRDHAGEGGHLVVIHLHAPIPPERHSQVTRTKTQK